MTNSRVKKGKSIADNLVKFVYAASATPEQIASFDANTIYFIGGSGAGEGGRLYKGPRLYDAGSSAAAAELAQLKTYIGTLPVDAPYTDLIDYIDKTVAAAQAAGWSYELFRTVLLMRASPITHA